MSPVAAVDVGTNSVRLLIMNDEGTRVLRRIVTTRLGYGVDRTGKLDDAALARTLTVLEQFRTDWLNAGVTDTVRIIATSAVRDATDRDRFFAGVEQVTGHVAEVISGSEEAALAFYGAVNGVGFTDACVVVDIGGGSTELVLGDANQQVIASTSLQLGCVRITERNFTSDPVTADQIAAAKADIARALGGGEAVFHAAKQRGVSALIGVAGTVTTMGALHLQLPDYDEDAIHGAHIPSAALGRLAGKLVAMSSAERRALGPVQSGREDVLHAGALILAAVVDALGSDGVIVSERDSLDGVATELQ